jgi:hypothetical protein
LEAESFAEFSIMAYQMVKATQETAPRIKLPSPADGLLENQHKSDQEQVA